MAASIRILVLEDDTDMRELLAEVLSDRGFEVVSASGSAQALELSRSESFDLIIADIRMEGLSGLDTIEQAKEHHPGLGSIVISGYASEEETLRAVKLNVGGYLKKPFKMQDLLNQINQFVAQKSADEKRQREVNALKQALLWSLTSLGTLGEKLQPGKVMKSAEVAQAVASHLEVASQTPEELRSAAILQQLSALEKLPLPAELQQWVESLPTLRRALSHPDPNSEVASFAARLCREFDLYSEPPESLWPEVDSQLLTAYQSWVKEGEAAPASAGDNRVSRLRLARTLEHTNKLDEAEKVYRELLAEPRLASSRDALTAWLGLARLGLARNDRPSLETAVKQTLELAEKHGPVSLGLSQLEAANILARAEHTATEKLLTRACATLASVHLVVDHARAVLRLAAVGSTLNLEQLEPALTTLASPAHLSEVFEHLGEIIADLTSVRLRGEHESSHRLLSRLTRDHPQEVTRLLRRESLTTSGKELLLDILEEHDDVPGDILKVLAEDSDPGIKTRALNLRAGAEAPPVLRVYSLGTEAVSLGDREIQESEWKSSKIKHTFLYIASQRKGSAVVDLLLEEFWPGPAEAARNNMNAAVSAIRKTLRDADSDSQWNPVLREHDRLSLNPKMVLWHDLAEFQKAYKAGVAAEKNSQPSRALAHFRRAVQLHRGPFLESCYMEWALNLKESCLTAFQTSLQHLITHGLEAGSYQEALEYSIRMLSVSPDSQDAHHAKMRAHLGLGQAEDVIKQYETCARMLKAEYDMEPNTELLRTFHQARYGLGETTSSL